MAVRQIRWFPYIAPSVVERLQATLSMPLNDRGISDYASQWIFIIFFIEFKKIKSYLSGSNLREYDTVARADNYFAEYRMLFSRRHSNERDIFRGSCIDVITSRLRKNLKAPASSRIMPFLKTNKQTNKTKLRQNMWCSFAEQLCFISVKVIIGTRVMCIFWIIYSRQ
jgi:hypothetical protein